jgi:molybdate transport system substrate-binding protein
MKFALRLGFAFAFLFAASTAQAAEITMIASNAVKAAYTQLLPAFEKASGHHVTVSWVGTADAIKRVNAGEVADIVIAPHGTIDALIAGGKLVPGSRMDLVKSLTAVAVRAGLPKPDISSGEALKRALLASKGVIVSGGPSGTYMLQLFEKMGIAEQIKPKMKQLAPGANPGEALVHGEGDIGFTQVSEFLPVKGINYVGPLPHDVELVTVFSSGIPRNAREPEAAKALVAFVTSPAAAAVVKRSGLEPGQ